MTIPGGTETPVPPRRGRSDGDLPITPAPPPAPRLPRIDALPLELIASFGDGVVAFDRELRHTAWNPRMEELTGVASDAAIGKGLIEVAVREARTAGCEWLHVDFEDELKPFYFDTCGFEPTNAGLIPL